MRLPLSTSLEADLGEIGGWTVRRANLDHLIVQKAWKRERNSRRGDMYERWRWALTWCSVRRWKR